MQGDKISRKPIDKPKTSIFQLANEKACTILDTAFSFKFQFSSKNKTQYSVHKSTDWNYANKCVFGKSMSCYIILHILFRSPGLCVMWRWWRPWRRWTRTTTGRLACTSSLMIFGRYKYKNQGRTQGGGWGRGEEGLPSRFSYYAFFGNFYILKSHKIITSHPPTKIPRLIIVSAKKKYLLVFVLKSFKTDMSFICSYRTADILCTIYKLQ